jgi:hypothetical protein
MWMRGRGYNADTLGPSGTGSHSQIEALLRKQAESEQAPPDWCFVNNFADPQSGAGCARRPVEVGRRGRGRGRITVFADLFPRHDISGWAKAI